VRPGELDVLESCLYVADLEAARAFYEGILGLEVRSTVPGRHLFFRLVGSMLLLFIAEASRQGGELPGHGAKGPGHFCFRIEEDDYEAWKGYLAEKGIEIVAEQTWSGGAKSFYFHDPDGNVLEMAPARIWR
jgi:catechol 2,3-dioxygenase-like lactoylglutathione lyase family enzyme